MGWADLTKRPPVGHAPTKAHFTTTIADGRDGWSRAGPGMADTGQTGSGDWDVGADIRVRMIKWQIQLGSRERPCLCEGRTGPSVAATLCRAGAWCALGTRHVIFLTAHPFITI
jgi:hypothetical protein